MIFGQSQFLKRAFICSFILVAISFRPVMAGPVVDIVQHHPIGTVTIDKTGDQAYFSLGNGRAIQFFLTGKKAEPAIITDLLARKADKSAKIRPVRRRNLKW